MIQRRTWKDVTPLPNGEGVMEGNTVIIGQISFAGMTYQFTGPHPDDIAEQAARWLQQNTGRDEVEPLVLVVGQHSFVLTKILTPDATRWAAVVVSESATKPKVYR